MVQGPLHPVTSSLPRALAEGIPGMPVAPTSGEIRIEARDLQKQGGEK